MLCTSSDCVISATVVAITQTSVSNCKEKLVKLSFEHSSLLSSIEENSFKGLNYLKV